MMAIKCVLGIVFTSLLVGCATPPLSVTYYTEPAGGTVFQGSQHMGRAPVCLSYPVSDYENRNGSKLLAPITVQWVSGARTTTGTNYADLRKYGFSQQLTVNRPPDAPNAQIDAAYGAQLEQAAAQQDAANAAGQNAYWKQMQMWQNIGQQMGNQIQHQNMINQLQQMQSEIEQIQSNQE